MDEKVNFVEGISKILVKMKVISPEDAESLVHDFKVSPKARFDYFLLEEGIVEKDDLLRALSEFYQIPYFDVEGFMFIRDLLILFPQDLLIRHACMPIETDSNMMTLVVSDPLIEDLREELGEYVSHALEFRVGLRRDIIGAIPEFYDKSDRELEEEKSEEESGNTPDDDDIVDLIS